MVGFSFIFHSLGFLFKGLRGFLEARHSQGIPKKKGVMDAASLRIAGGTKRGVYACAKSLAILAATPILHTHCKPSRLGQESNQLIWPKLIRCLELTICGSRRFESPPVRNDFKSHDSNRKAKNRLNRCKGFTFSFTFKRGFTSRDSDFEPHDPNHGSRAIQDI